MANETEKNELILSWAEFHTDVLQLAKKIEQHGKTHKGILAITRGGMVPSGILATELNIKNIDTLCLSSYSDKQQDGMEVIKQPQLKNEGEGWLVVDDLVDTGKTFEVAREFYPKATFVAVYEKPMGAKTADIAHRPIAQGTWIYFPWDHKNHEGM